MTSALVIDEKKFYPIKDVATKVSYSRDYITRLARENKIVATNIGRQWFVDIDSLNNYVETSAMESSIRKKQLSEERKREQQIRQVSERKREQQLKKAKSLNLRAVLAASTVLTFGLLTGWATNFLLSENTSPMLVANTFQVPSAPSSNVSNSELNEVAPINKSNLTVASVSTPEPVLDVSPTQNLRPISEKVEEGILLLPVGSVNASPTEMFSDDVEVLTAENGTQMIVRIDENGKQVGNVIPFITVPIKHSEL